MTFLDLIDLITLTCLISVTGTLLVQRLGRYAKDQWERRLPPRYLKPCGVRRRAPVSDSSRATDESI